MSSTFLCQMIRIFIWFIIWITIFLVFFCLFSIKKTIGTLLENFFWVMSNSHIWFHLIYVYTLNVILFGFCEKIDDIKKKKFFRYMTVWRLYYMILILESYFAYYRFFFLFLVCSSTTHSQILQMSMVECLFFFRE